MVALARSPSSSVAEVAVAAAASLVSVRQWGETAFINLPLIYPGGGFVTVKIDQAGRGIFRISDNGFAYREIEAIGAQRSFAKTAPAIIEPLGVDVDARSVFVDAPVDQLARAICDVAIASWQIADRIVSRASEEEEGEIQEYLKDRLPAIFGKNKVDLETKLIGSSRSEWELSAVVRLPKHIAVFQAVPNFPISVYRTSAAFHDLSALKSRPSLTAVVRKKSDMGPRLAILAQAGRVIEEDQPDAAYLRAAA